VAFRRRLPLPLQQRDFALLWIAIFSSGFGSQMAAVAVGWQVYAIHRSAFDLGLIGLAEFVPLLVLALPAGQFADRVPRRLVFALSEAIALAVLVLLVVVSASGAHQLWPFLALAAALGVAGALGAPAGRALPAMVVPFELIPSAMAIRSIAFQVATIAGPALGGFLFSIRPEVVYATAAGIIALGFVALLGVHVPAMEASGEASHSPQPTCPPPAVTSTRSHGVARSRAGVAAGTSGSSSACSTSVGTRIASRTASALARA